ncbi:MAG: hypothetical protein JWQ90_1567 [Hydrocarboniphaga sp.]|uniref:hypothetical protein n=1 Tax=Hydrocarboniphaga sp. TaxID=2033016 RepID=UPI00263824A5|nr:hypothetical protein [Hydrocarboniphaga sp.]MDB5969117.1 hypothetical protein [Hydrocarboniphaga sp.]
MKIQAIPLVAVLSSLLSACGGGDSDVKVYKYDESVQCNESSGVPLATMQQELTNAGIDVLCAQKGNDGQAWAAVCGGGTGNLNVYLIRHSNLDDAEALGFGDTDELDFYSDSPCES